MKTQISKPLVWYFVWDNCGHPLLISSWIFLLVEKKSCLSECDQAPVLHCPRNKVRYGNQICKWGNVCYRKITSKMLRRQTEDLWSTGRGLGPEIDGTRKSIWAMSSYPVSVARRVYQSNQCRIWRQMPLPPLKTRCFEPDQVLSRS